MVLLLLLAFLAVPSRTVRIPSVISYELKQLVRSMLGDGGNELIRFEDFKILLVLAMVHP